MTSAEGRLFCTSCSKAALSEKWVLFPSLSGHNINNFVVGGGGGWIVHGKSVLVCRGTAQGGVFLTLCTRKHT